MVQDEYFNMSKGATNVLPGLLTYESPTTNFIILKKVDKIK